MRFVEPFNTRIRATQYQYTMRFATFVLVARRGQVDHGYPFCNCQRYHMPNPRVFPNMERA